MTSPEVPSMKNSPPVLPEVNANVIVPSAPVSPSVQVGDATGDATAASSGILTVTKSGVQVGATFP